MNHSCLAIRLSNSAILIFALLFSFSSCKTETTEYIYRNTFTVNFYPNGGSGKMESQTYVQNKVQALSKNAFENPKGKVFSGWATDEDSNETVYSDTQSIKVEKNLNLYAIWKAEEGSGEATETKAWLFDGYVDSSVRPGDGFYKYVLGNWLKNPKEVGVWKTVQNHSEDDNGVIENQETLGNEFVNELMKDENKYGYQNPVIQKFNELFPDTDDEVSRELAYIKQKLNKIDEISDVKTLRKEFIKNFMIARPMFDFIINYNDRLNKYFDLMFSASALNSIIFVYDDNLTLAQMFEKTNYVKVNKNLDFYKELLGIKTEEDEKNHIKAVSSFLYAFSYLYDWEDDDPHEVENELSEYLTSIGLDIKDLHLGQRVKEYLIIFDLVGLPNYEDLSFENAKETLKFFIARNDLHCIFNKKAIFLSQPFCISLAKSYKDVFDPDGKKKDYVQNMCEEFRETFEKRLKDNPWMSDSSKEKAITKLKQMVFFCGYLDNFPDEYFPSKSEISGCSTFLEFYDLFYRTTLTTQIKRFTDESVSEKDKILEAIFFDRGSEIFDANAVYRRSLNSIEILITNLSDPICNLEYPDAYNYAVLGASTIGHEICHAFDAIGTKYDENGIEKDWWTLYDKLTFEEKKGQMRQVFDLFCLDSKVTVTNDTSATLNENIADFGGLITAYDLFVTKKIKEGFAGEELVKQKKMFFESFAIAWSNTNDDNAWRVYMLGNDHSPAPFRVNGSLSLIDEWYDIYGVQKGDKYYLSPSQRIVMW